MVIKRSGVRQAFDRGKLIDGLRSATKNRPVTEEQLEVMAREVEDELREDGSEPTSEQVGLAVLERLRLVDEVAYLRFASVYKGFEGVDDFRREVGLLTKTTAPEATGGLGHGRAADRSAGPGTGHLCPSRRPGRLVRWARWPPGRRPAARSASSCAPTAAKGRRIRRLDPAELVRPPGGRVGRGGRACLGVAGLEWLNHPDGELADDAGLQGGAGGRGPARSDPTSCSAPIPRPSSSDRTTSTTGTTGSPAWRRSMPWLRPRHSRTTFPMPAPAHQVTDGAAVGHPGARRVGGHLVDHRRQG